MTKRTESLALRDSGTCLAHALNNCDRKPVIPKHSLSGCTDSFCLPLKAQPVPFWFLIPGVTNICGWHSWLPKQPEIWWVITEREKIKFWGESVGESVVYLRTAHYTTFFLFVDTNIAPWRQASACPIFLLLLSLLFCTVVFCPAFITSWISVSSTDRAHPGHWLQCSKHSYGQ